MPYLGDIGEITETGRSGFSSFEWKIPGFLSLVGERGDYYTSPDFHALDGWWYFRLYPNGLFYSESVDIILRRNGYGPPKTLSVTLGIKGAEGEENRRGRTHKFSGDDRACYWETFCLRSQLRKQESKLMPSRTLILTIDMRDVSPGVTVACVDNELHKKEMESLMEQIKILKKTVGKYRAQSENCIKQMGTSESEPMSCAEQGKSRIKLTISSRLEKDSSIQTEDECKDHKFLTGENQSSEEQAACDNSDAEGRNDENVDEENEKSKTKKSVKQRSKEKNTKKISLLTRHDNVIRSLKSILAEGSRADLTLKSDSREWPVHMAILEGRSGYFETLFQGAETDEVRFDDVTEGALDRVLQFIYTGEVQDMSLENVSGIHNVAHTFLLQDLESLCVECMREEMCPKIVCEALTIAHQYGEEGLKESALECFFRETNTIVATEGWKQLKKNHPAIIGELFEELIKRER